MMAPGLERRLLCTRGCVILASTNCDCLNSYVRSLSVFVMNITSVEEQQKKKLVRHVLKKTPKWKKQGKNITLQLQSSTHTVHNCFHICNHNIVFPEAVRRDLNIWLIFLQGYCECIIFNYLACRINFKEVYFNKNQGIDVATKHGS